MKKIFFWIFILVFVLLAIEATSFFAVKYFLQKRLIYHTRVDEKEFRHSILNSRGGNKIAPIPFLGWDENQAKEFKLGNVSYGTVSRVTPYPSDTVIAAAFGDSFTYCQDVKEDETWEYYLSTMADGVVLNYGVRGYGTDQAVFKLQSRLEKGLRAPIVILGVLSENIARVVNVSPKHYWAIGGVSAFKPLATERNGKLEWTYDYLTDLGSREGRMKALDAISSFDYWSRVNDYRPSFSFPYAFSVFKTMKYLSFDVKRWQNLWKEERPVKVMRFIVEKFYSLSEEFNFVPVVVFIPEAFDIRQNENKKPVTYGNFIKNITEDYAGKKIIFVDVLKSQFAGPKFNIAAYQGHASAYGNKVIAAKIFENLKNRNMLPVASNISKD